jgi:hypothetical protein
MFHGRSLPVCHRFKNNLRWAASGKSLTSSDQDPPLLEAILDLQDLADTEGPAISDSLVASNIPPSLSSYEAEVRALAQNISRQYLNQLLERIQQHETPYQQHETSSHREQQQSTLRPTSASVKSLPQTSLADSGYVSVLEDSRCSFQSEPGASQGRGNGASNGHINDYQPLAWDSVFGTGQLASSQNNSHIDDLWDLDFLQQGESSNTAQGANFGDRYFGWDAAAMPNPLPTAQERVG